MSRILNRQRQMAEQGRIRLGYTTTASNGKTRPTRSETFILTSHSREHIEAAANLWGGEVEQWQPMGNGAQQWRVITRTAVLPAILPPGDPLTQAHELWTKGGCQRRCNGETEEFSGSPCLCFAQFGPDWHEHDAREVCQTKSRLKVLLPDMPGLGTWRMETGSFYATDEIAGMVDFIRGAVGGQALVPVSLRIEQRTRVADGKTKHFPVPVIDLRDVTAGALMAGQVQTLGQAPPPKSLQAPPVAPSYLNPPVPAGPSNQGDPYAPFTARAEAATSREELGAVWSEAVAAGLVGEHSEASPARAAFAALVESRGKSLAAAQQPAADQQPDADGAVDADVVDDADAVWESIVREGGKQGMTLPDLQEGFAAFTGGLIAADATAGELTAYLEHLRAGVPA